MENSRKTYTTNTIRDCVCGVACGIVVIIIISSSSDNMSQSLQMGERLRDLLQKSICHFGRKMRRIWSTASSLPKREGRLSQRKNRGGKCTTLNPTSNMNTFCELYPKRENIMSMMVILITVLVAADF